MSRLVQGTGIVAAVAILVVARFSAPLGAPDAPDAGASAGAGASDASDGGAGADPDPAIAVRDLPPLARMLAAELLWLRAIAHLDDGRFEPLLGDVDMLLRVTDYDEFALSYWASELATTVGRSSGDPAVEKEWFGEAVRRLESGLRRHPGSSMLHARLGEIHLDLLTRDPRLRGDYREAYGRLPAQAALECFQRALALDRDAVRWVPEIVRCRFLIADELLLEGDPKAAREAMRRVPDDFSGGDVSGGDSSGGIGAGDPGSNASAGHPRDALRGDPVAERFVDRASRWVEILDGAVRLEETESEAERRESKRRILELLDRLIERYPEDTLAADFAHRLRGS